MRLKLFLVFLSVSATLGDVLQEQNHEEIDPIQQTQHDSEANDQSKRFLFGEDNNYAFEKHVKYYRGQKHLLGYRPVRLQYLPVARPLYHRPMKHYRPVKQHAQRPVVSLVPPKVNSNYKPYGTLPVNVPPNVPDRPWQTQGWDVKPEDNKPFVPSVPDATVASTVQPIPVQPTVPVLPSVQPVVPNFVAKPVFVHGPQALPTFPSVPVLPAPQATFVPLHTSVPVHPVHHIHPVQHIHPVPPIHQVQTVHPIQPLPVPFPNVVQKPLVPINFLPGRNIGHPGLGVLPLGATIPVQLTPQAPHVVHKQILVQEPHFVAKPQILVQNPAVHRVPEFHPNVQLQGGFTPIENPPPHVYHQSAHLNPVHQNVVYHQHHHGIPGQQLPHNPQVFQNVHPAVYHQNPGFPQAQSPQNPGIVQNEQPIVYSQQPQNFPQSNHQPQPLPGPGVQQQEPPHNYFYFAKGPGTHINNQIDFNQQQQDFNQHQPDFNQQQHDFNHQQHDFNQQQHDFNQQQHGFSQHQHDFNQPEFQQNINFDQNFEQPAQHQGYEDNQGYYQPGKTDLQIPDYLPDHPHLRNNYQDNNYQDNNYEAQKR